MSVKRCQELNPLVSVSAECCAVSSKEEEYFRHFDVICLIRQSFGSLELLILDWLNLMPINLQMKWTGWIRYAGSSAKNSVLAAYGVGSAIA